MRCEGGSTDVLIGFYAANEEGNFNSTLSTWALSNEPFIFSEAFPSLECKKLDLTRGLAEWVSFLLPLFLPLSLRVGN